MKKGTNKKVIRNKIADRKQGPKFRKLVLAAMIFIAVGVITFTAVATYVLADIVKTVNGDLIVDLDDYIANQDRTSFIYGYDKNGKLIELFKLHGVENRVWVSIDEMPEDLLNAFIALEDKRFNNHKGVDWFRTTSVVFYHGLIKNHSFEQGGSTITQQLIKNLTGEDGRIFSRKYNEILSALNLEKSYNKKTIIEAYLNTLYLNQGCYGVKTASQQYFGKDVSELNISECASLAAITQAPYTYDPILHPEKNRERQLLCLKNMFEQGYIENKKDYEAAIDYKMVFTNSKGYVPPKSSNKKDEPIVEKTSEISDYYIDFVIESVITDLALKQNITRGDAERKVLYGGLKIYSAVNIEVQKIVNDVYSNRKSFANDKTQSAITIMDYSGRVVAIAGGAGKKTMIRGLNRAADSPRQPGSAIKPLSVYAPGIEEGRINYSSLIQNYGILLNTGKRWPVNYGGSLGDPKQYVTVQYAVAQSHNTVAVQVCRKVSIQTCFDYLKDKFHFTTLVEKGSQTDINLSSLAVGGMTRGVTTLEMAAAFATFGNGGMYYKPYCYTKVTNSDGSQVLLEHKETKERAISEGTSVVMRKLLETVVSGGTASGYGVSRFRTFAKTGTTSDNYDRWFVGGTPHYVAAVWYGYDTNKEIRASGNPAGRIFSKVMNDAHKDLKTKSFKDSSEVVSRQYCTKTGLL
ncbi:MAG TPA: transglycosylase domain-containing protein, partial [Oscillospiraceae bacterium]|nr:transglycosylase domain-containing protein [Oscillospiraceae bacterium]